MRDEFRNPITKAVHQLVEGICYNKASLTIKEAESGDVLAITILPHPSDARFLVGKEGRVIKALEWLARRAGEQANIKCLLSMEDAFSGDSKSASVTNPELDLDVLKRLMLKWTSLVFDSPVGMDFRNGSGTLRIYLAPAKTSANDEIVIRALDSLFFQYGKSNGHVVYVRSKSGD